jgi:4-amino-4-deoxy-L-arabinose transferase-like glycosyltransferase/sugar lactone lactonase YvrE
LATTERDQNQTENPPTVDDTPRPAHPADSDGDPAQAPAQGDPPGENGHAAEPTAPARVAVRPVRRVLLTRPQPAGEAAPAGEGAAPPVLIGTDAPVEVAPPPGNGHAPVPALSPAPPVPRPGLPPAEQRRRLARVWRDEVLPPTVRVAPDAEAAPAATPRPGLLAAFTNSWFWRGRGLWFGGIAVALALYGQKLVTEERDIVPAIRWYAAAIILMILAWLGTYRNKSFLTLPPLRRRAVRGTLPVRVAAAASGASVAEARPGLAARLAARLPTVPLPQWVARLLGNGRWRYGVAFLALGLNLWSMGRIQADYYSSAGGSGWVISLVMLVLAFVGERPQPGRDADAGISDIEDETDPKMSRRVEWAIFLGIFAIALALRFYRLDDWTMGVHGDEGEAGMDALNIYRGNHVSPFQVGWFAQPNFYYWGIAAFMPFFGTGLEGVRMFATVFGSLMFLPFYPLVRMWFGVRTAIIATFFLAISDVTIHFTRIEFSNITTPACLVAGFYFLFLGLRTRRNLFFVLSGYAYMLSLYFYNGGRLTPFLLVAVLGYLFVLLPLVNLPRVYGAVRQRLPRLSRRGVLGEALRTQVRGVLFYAPQLVIFLIANIVFATGFLAYYLDHTGELNARAGDKLIFTNEARMVAQYGAQHGPLYVGLRMPRPDDIYPFSPLVFEQTPLSVKVSDDGFWLRVLWGQTTTTLSVLTYRFEASSVYTFTQEPTAKPIEAALIILGLAWAAWRWRDSRMAILSLWFWSFVFVGGVLTIDAPYMARLVGIIPAMAILAAIPLSKLSAELIRVVTQYGRRPAMRPVARVFSGVVVGAILLWLLGENYSDYFYRYVANWPFTEVTGQAYFVRQMNERTAAEGRPTPQYYDMGAHLIYWGHGVNRYLNHDTPGRDMVNPTQELPVIDNGDRDVVFMVWDNNRQYLPVIEQYYPDGQTEQYYHSPTHTTNYLFTAYRVKREAIDALRFLRASYTPATGPAIQRNETTLGTGADPPASLAYPVQASWTGNLVAPGYGRYQFRLDSTAAGSFVIDGTPVLTGTGGSVVQAEVILARGPHALELRGTLPSAKAHVQVQWAVGGSGFSAVPRTVLWSGPGRGLLGEIRSYGTADVLAPQVAVPTGPGDGVYQRRIDGFLGFRATHDILTQGGGIAARWRGTLVAPQAGIYTFETYANGQTAVYIDDHLVVNNPTNSGTASNVSGQIELTPGPHHIEVGYTWTGGTGYLELYWTPPGGERQLIGPQAFQADGGLWPVGTVLDPGPVRLPAELGQPTRNVAPTRILEAHSDLQAPRGLAIDARGNLYIADTGHHRVVELDSQGKVIRTLGKEGTGPGEFGTVEDIAVGPDGKIYVLEAPGPARIHVFNPDGTLDHVIAGEWCSPAGFTVGPDNMIYVADTCGSRIMKHAPDGTRVAEYRGSPDPALRFEQPVDVAVAADGSIYVADLRHRIVELDPSGTMQRTWPTHVGGNRGAGNLALVGNTLYLTDPDQNRVTAIDRATGRSDQFGQAGDGPGAFGDPTGIAGGPDGQIYVVDSDHARVEVFPALTFPP